MNIYLFFVPSDCLFSPVSPQDDEDKLTWKDRFPGYLMNFASILFMVISLREPPARVCVHVDPVVSVCKVGIFLMLWHNKWLTKVRTQH